MPAYVIPHLRNRDQNPTVSSPATEPQLKVEPKLKTNFQGNPAFQNSSSTRGGSSNFNRRRNNFGDSGKQSDRGSQHSFDKRSGFNTSRAVRPVTAVSYLEKHAKEASGSQSQENRPNTRIANWDVRASKITSLGFHGQTIEDERDIAELFGSQHSTGINFDKYDDIPVETSGTDVPSPISSFTEAALPERLKRNLTFSNFSKPTPVQKYSIPIGLANRDLMACAQTGSGKTGGFLFPIIALLLKNGALVPDRPDHRRAFPNALILAPTRELAVQIFEEGQKFTYCTGIRSVVVYGGANIVNQAKELSLGADLLVATPGRLTDFCDRGSVSLCCVQQLVLDEADRMLDMGFEPAIRKIVEELDLPRDRRTFMFSATFPKEIQRLAGDFMQDYIFLTVGKVGSAASDITQTIERVEEDKKKDVLVNVLSAVEGGLVLVFVETKRSADNLQYFLEQQSFPTTSIHGDRIQAEREKALESFRTGKTPILVATDVAARGLDIDNVTFVINFDLPNSIDDYVHRIGRTGRAGNKGTALSFFTDKNMAIAPALLLLLQENKQEIPPWLQSLGKPQYSSRTYSQNNQARDFRPAQRAAHTATTSGSKPIFSQQQRRKPAVTDAW